MCYNVGTENEILCWEWEGGKTLTDEQLEQYIAQLIEEQCSGNSAVE